MSGRDLVRVGPIHFQSLEQELEPVRSYLTGHLLNAGCGSRDITGYLIAGGVSRVTKYDIESSDPEVVIGPLEQMPFADCSFDSALCNAVLEHVMDAEQSMRELVRVVRPGGHIVVAVPFLQPFHAAPGDFRRYTADGLAQFGRNAGLEVVAVLPVHSFAQTLGWILWEYALEKRGTLRRAVAWTIAFALTRLWNRTDASLVQNANTFQAVFRRNGQEESISDSAASRAFGTTWKQRPVPVASASVPTMLIPDELRLLHHLTDVYYRGEGAIVDAGTFLGGSTVAMADGLRRNLRRRGAPESKIIHSYDRFEVEDYTVGKFFPRSTPLGTSFRADFDRNVAAYTDLIEVHAGDILSHSWNGTPVEILFIDVAKHWTVCDWITSQFFPHLIPGRSVVVQQDYLYNQWTAWLHVTMEVYWEYFEYLCDTGLNSVAFLNTRRIPASLLREKTVESLDFDEKVALMNRAADRFKGKRKELLQSARDQYVEIMRAAR